MMKVVALQILLLFLSTMASACLNSEFVFHLKTPECKPESWQQYPLLGDATIDTLQAGFNGGHFTSVDLVKAYLKRIEEVDSLNPVIETNPDALAIAAELDAERSAGIIRGPLHGIPILIKENIATNDKMNTTSGSYALLGAKVPRDSTVARKLRDSGAVILGKSNLSQWANFRSVDTTNGWSSMGGQTYGPYYPGQDPSGSSSGSAVASALGLALGCLGTETDGSILSPSSKNSIVGIKPTLGLTSRDLVIPISERQDTIGPMTRTVKDAAFILQAIAGVDPYDNYTSAIPNNGVVPDYVSACQLSALSGARIGISRNMMELRAVKTQFPAFEKAISVIKAAGATIIDNIDFPSAAEYLDSGVKDLIIQADFPVNLASYLSQLTENPNNVTTLAEVREFTRSSNDEEFPGRDTALWDRILFEQAWDNTDPRFWDAYQRTLYYNGEGGLLGAIDRLNLDAVISPSDGTHTFAAGVGAPVITVPLGFSAPDTAVVRNSRDLVTAGPNLPFGISFMGAKFTEAKLIGLAYAFEQKTHTRGEGKMYISPNTKLVDVL
ncbi:glutamyl-tRNA amidotransferase subunit A [Hypoxylon cercidicola]|nr:glutamyl-tRNA amidotransferase subunit A [Hypoxylon cercidicola]